MNLAEYISNLLYENDKVIIPDFGGFICIKKNASIHPVEHKFTPAFSDITFDQNIKQNDNLLLNHIIKTENITKTEAEKIVADFVNNTNKELKEGKRVQLKNIGFLFIDINAKIKLDYDKKLNYLKESYGLSSFNSPAIQRKEVKEKMIKEAAIESKPKKSKAPIWISIAAIIVILIVLGFLKQDLITDYIASFSKETEVEEVESTAQNIENNADIEEEVTVVDTIESVVSHENDSVEEIVSDENPTEEIEEIPTEVASTEIQNYYIVAGCF